MGARALKKKTDHFIIFLRFELLSFFRVIYANVPEGEHNSGKIKI
jgi:hypothetical protein